MLRKANDIFMMTRLDWCFRLGRMLRTFNEVTTTYEVVKQDSWRVNLVICDDVAITSNC